MTPPTATGLAFWVGSAAFAVGVVVYGAAVVHSPVIDDVLAQERIVLNKHARRDRVNVEREQAFAEAYWRRNPDVAENTFFGENGALGLFGAREHFDRHGRSEGRRWGR